MAPKRAAKKAAPPPPPPPAESSDETRSGSRSRSEESEDEDAIAESPVPAATPAPKNTPAPAQNGGESSDEEEEEEEEEEKEEEEEEEEDQPARAAAKNKPPPPQKKEDSGSEEEEEEEEEDEEEKEEEPTRAAPPSVPKKQPPQPQKKDDSDEEEEEEEEEAPPPKPAQKKAALALKAAAPAAAADEAKKPGGFHRIWSTDDEVRILEALAAHQKEHGAFPQPEDLMDVLAGKLDNPAYGSKELHSKVKSLRVRYLTLSNRGEVPSKEHDRRVLDLSRIVWDGDKTAITAAASNGHGQKGFEEMCALYPYLAEEVKELEAAKPGSCKRVFGKLDDDKARAMDEKIKKQRVLQTRVEMRRGDLSKEVTKALMDLVDG